MDALGWMLSTGYKHPPLSHGVKYYRAIGSSHYALQTGQVSHLPCEKLMAVAT